MYMSIHTEHKDTHTCVYAQTCIFTYIRMNVYKLIETYNMGHIICVCGGRMFLRCFTNILKHAILSPNNTAISPNRWEGELLCRKYLDSQSLGPACEYAFVCVYASGCGCLCACFRVCVCASISECLGEVCVGGVGVCTRSCTGRSGISTHPAFKCVCVNRLSRGCAYAHTHSHVRVRSAM